MPVKRLFQIAVQIAEGLARAHEAGIVHRDLKPENVMVTKDGLVKILDFGLAKQVGPVSGSEEGSHLPTETGTSPGVVLGTVGYMSPEQAAGQLVDFRSDQFSFGSILYEMATGKRAFQKGTAVDTLSAILHEEPKPIAETSPGAPAPLRWIVERCLAKDPEGRYAATKDLTRELATIRDHLSEASTTSESPAAHGPRRARALVAVGGAALLAVLAAGIQVGRQIAKTTPPVFKRLTFQRGNVAAARFTRDGQTIVYTASWNGEPWRLFSTRRDSPESSPLPLPDGSFIRGISPSGELAVVAGNTLSRVPLSGGAPREVLDGIRTADWAPDGSSFAVIRNVGGKTRLEYPAGRILYETAGGIGWARISPGGDLVAFLDYPITGDELGSSVAVVDRGGKKRTLASGFMSSGGVVWSRDGREVWFTAEREGIPAAMYAVSLSGKERLLLRTPVRGVVLDVAADGSVLMDQHTPSMRIIGLAPGESRERDLSWLDMSFASDLSSDGRNLLFDESGDGAGKSYRLYSRRTDGSLPALLGEGSYGVLSSDGAWALSLVGKQQQRQIVLLPTKSGESKHVPLDGVTPQYAWFLRDDKSLLVAGYEPGHGQRLYVKNLAGGRPRPLGPEGVSSFTFAGTKPISPDGEWIFARGDDGKISLYGVENRQARLLPGASAGDRPLQWTADGRGIYVMNRKGNAFSIFRIEVATGLRDLWKEIVPPDTAGFSNISSFFIAADGRSYVYSYSRVLADLYLVSGLK